MSSFSFPFLTEDDVSRSRALAHELLRHGKFHAAVAVMKSLYARGDKKWVVDLLDALARGIVPATWNATDDVPSVFHLAWLAFLQYKAFRAAGGAADAELFTLDVEGAEKRIHFGILLVDVCARRD